MSRITKSVLEARVTALSSALGTNFRLEREWKGWAIAGSSELSNGDRIYTQPFGANIHSAQELYHMINFALRAVQVDRQGVDHASYWPKDKGAA